MSDINLILEMFKQINSFFFSPVKRKEHDAQEWKVSSDTVKKGDVFTIEGRTEPDSAVRMDVSFSDNIPVIDGKYKKEFKDVDISFIPNQFIVETTDIADMTFTVHMIIPFRKRLSATEGKCTYIDKDVPPGTYDITIDGRPGEGVASIPMTIKASQSLISDKEGNFTYNYNTGPFPPGTVSVSIGEQEKKVRIVD